MKKIVIGVVLVVVVAAVAVPVVNGIIAEKIVRNALGDINALYADTGQDVSFQITRFDRGFLSSEVESTVNLGGVASLYDVKELLILTRVQHGYLGLKSETSLERNVWYRDFVKEKMDGKDPLTILANYSFNGDIESIVAVSPVSFDLEGQQLTIKEGRIRTFSPKGFRHFVSTGSFAGLELGDVVTIGPIAMDYELDRISTYLWSGDMSFRFASMDIKEDGEVFGMTNFTGDYVMDYQQESDLYGFSVRLGADSFGDSEMKLNKAVMNFAVSGLVGAEFEAFMKIYTKSMAAVLRAVSEVQGDAEATERVVQEQMMKEGMQMVAAYEKLLKKGLQIEVSELSVVHPQGEIQASGGVELKEDLTFMQLAPITSNPELAFELLSLHTEVKFPKTLVESTDNLVNPLFPGMETGIFVEDGELLIHTAQTKDGKLIVNQKEVQFN